MLLDACPVLQSHGRHPHGLTSTETGAIITMIFQSMRLRPFLGDSTTAAEISKTNEFSDGTRPRWSPKRIAAPTIEDTCYIHPSTPSVPHSWRLHMCDIQSSCSSLRRRFTPVLAIAPRFGRDVSVGFGGPSNSLGGWPKTLSIMCAHPSRIARQFAIQVTDTERLTVLFCATLIYMSEQLLVKRCAISRKFGKRTFLMKATQNLGPLP